MSSPGAIRHFDSEEKTTMDTSERRKRSRWDEDGPERSNDKRYGDNERWELDPRSSSRLELRPERDIMNRGGVHAKRSSERRRSPSGNHERRSRDRQSRERRSSSSNRLVTKENIPALRGDEVVFYLILSNSSESIASLVTTNFVRQKLCTTFPTLRNVAFVSGAVAQKEYIVKTEDEQNAAKNAADSSVRTRIYLEFQFGELLPAVFRSGSFVCIYFALFILFLSILLIFCQN
jgi:hypothetical protein